MTVVLLFFLASLMASIPNANATTAVTVLQSLNKQLPLVARTGQPYSWTFLPSTFSSTEGSLNYTTSILPGWLSFDQATQTFHGTPSASDEGYPEITVTAHSADSSASSKFTICVTHASPPTLNHPLEQQFLPNNKTKSLSSVLFLRNNSAIGGANPTLRIPRKWSFSVGIESNTFLGVSGSNVFYELRLANGSRIPDFMNFNSRTVTLDGVVPSADKISQPLFVPFVLYASDQEGYSSAELPFALVVADHELSLSGPSLPTINITIATPFAVTLLSAVDFTCVLVDGDPIQPSNISSLDIDVSNYSKWLRYDRASRTLSGTPGDDVTGTSPLLPVELTTIFNQTIKTNVSLNFVESYFVLPVLPSLHLSKGDQVQTTLTQWFSKSNSRPGYDGTNITASFEPMSSANFLRFDEYSTNLTGTIPSNFQSDSDHITVSFAAYSHITHTTSHTSLAIFVTDSGNTKTLAPTGSNAVGGDGHRKLILALVLSFGLIGGLCVLAGIFAIMRRWARLEDTALVGEEGRRAWSEKDRRWYGMMLNPNGSRIIEKQSVSDTVNDDPSSARPRGPRPNYGGLGLSRVVERSQQQTDSQEQLVSPGVMRKREFLARIKETVRQVSNKYARKQAMIYNRPTIGKPILVSSTRASGGQPDVIVHSSSSNPSDESLVTSCPGSTFLSGSPSASTAEHSIPRRRLDFAPPRNPAQVHFKEGLLVRQPSTGSMGCVSYRSGKSGISGDSLLETAMGPPTKPRLVPFTSSTRVPVPNPDGGGFTGNRIASQRAKVCKAEFKDEVEGSRINASATADELSMGLHYVRSLGADQLAVNNREENGSSPALSNIRSSFTSLESSHVGYKSEDGLSVTRVLIRAGERFKFRVPIFLPSVAGETYSIRLTSGQPLPKFIQSDLSCVAKKELLELSGLATFRDLGELNIGIFKESDGACIARIVLEVVGKR